MVDTHNKLDNEDGSDRSSNARIKLTAPKIGLSWLPLPKLEGSEIVMVPTHIGDDGSIYFHLYDEGEVDNQLESMIETFGSIYNAPNDLPTDDLISEGQICIAKYFLDKNWYRAEIVKIFKDNLEVFFIDYGNTELVKFDEIQTHVAFIDLPKMCYKARLYDVMIPASANGQWLEYFLDFLHDHIVDEVCSAHVEKRCECENALYMSINLPGNVPLTSILIKSLYTYQPTPEPILEGQPTTYSCSGEILQCQPTTYSCPGSILQCQPTTGTIPLEKKNAIFSLLEQLVDQSELLDKALTKLEMKMEKEFIKTRYIEMPIPAVGTKIPVVVAGFYENGLICLQMVKVDKPTTLAMKQINLELDHYQKLMQDLTENAYKSPLVENPKPGMSCCGQYTCDDNWYRCLVLDPPVDDTVTVFYVDYGNTEVLPLKRLRQLPADYLRCAKQGLVCQLHGWKPSNDDWSEESYYSMLHILLDGSSSETIFEAKIMCTGLPPEVIILPRRTKPKNARSFRSRL